MSPSRPSSDRARSPSTASLSGTNLERAGDHNQRVTLQAIRIGGPVTRTELAAVTGLTAPAIANITRRLLDDGLVLEAGKRVGGRGQPALRLAVDPDGALSVGVNLDRDHVTVVVLDLLGRVRARESREAELAAPEETAQRVGEMARAALARPELAGLRVVGSGVALPDDIARTLTPELQAAWRRADPLLALTPVLPGPVLLENDAAAAAIGEVHSGHGLDHATFFYILLSAGLGGGLVIEGDYFRGADGRSGEIGFLRVHSPRTHARTLEGAVSLTALYEHLRAHDVHVSRPDDLERLDARGAACLQSWTDLASELLLEPLLSVSWLVNPAVVLIGGRLPSALVDALAAGLNSRLLQLETDGPPPARVLRAKGSSDAPAIGAAVLPFLKRLLPSRSTLMKVVES